MSFTYEPIATQTLGSNTTSISFLNISNTYTDLVLVAVVKNSSSLNNGQIYFNNDTSSLYSGTYLQGSGSVVSGRVSNQNYCFTPEISTSQWTVIIANIMNFSNSSTFKTVLLRGGAANDRTAAWVNLYRSTNVINRIDFATFGGNLVSGSTFNLYGIKAE